MIRSFVWSLSIPLGAEDTKKALLEAAKQLILERGYAGATVRELAAAAGTNLGAVNYHFGSRENLLNQAMLEFVPGMGESCRRSDVDPEAEPLKQLADALPSNASRASPPRSRHL